MADLHATIVTTEALLRSPERWKNRSFWERRACYQLKLRPQLSQAYESKCLHLFAQPSHKAPWVKPVPIFVSLNWRRADGQAASEPLCDRTRFS
jgi:hypothetical protein